MLRLEKIFLQFIILMVYVYLLRCEFFSIYKLEFLNGICALSHSLKNISKENILKVLLYGAEESSFKINSEIFNCTIKCNKKQMALVTHYFFFIFFVPLNKNIYISIYIYISIMYRIYIKLYMPYVNFVSCVVLFYYFCF